MTKFGKRNSQNFITNTLSMIEDIIVPKPIINIESYEINKFSTLCKGKNCKGKHPLLPYNQQNPDCPYFVHQHIDNNIA